MATVYSQLITTAATAAAAAAEREAAEKYSQYP